MKKAYGIFGFLSLVFALAFAFNNCAGPSGGTLQQGGTQLASSTSSGKLMIGYAPSVLKVGDSIAITVTGGTSPYKFELSYGSGMLTQNIFKTSAEGYATLKVTDADSYSQYFSIFTGTVSGTGGYSGGVPQYPTAPVHRFYKALTGEHLYTLSSTEGFASGMTYEGISFNVLTSQVNANAIAIYRCVSNVNSFHFVSIQAACAGGKNEGIYGYAFNYSAINTVPVNSYLHPTLRDYLATTSEQEATSGGYAFIGLLGFFPK
ncbi:MAG: hypothetical protein H7326_00825 [Bdellovibrionaceae bacterium]|nr:hypothetical protein [Pseudobdellovibrionaceae bacterium]